MELLMVLLRAIAQLTNLIVQLYIYVVIARALISWVNPDPYNPIVRFLHNVTDPVLYRIRRIIPPLGGMDLSPIVLLIGLEVGRQMLMTLISMAMRAVGGY